MSGSKFALRESTLLTTLFLAALAYHFAGICFNWTVPFLSGHEFRQTQTALTTYYIDEQDNFGLLYETPILGKPWVSILLEVPIYEWCVVLVSRATGLPHFLAARTVSVASFYLMLPAAYLLLGRLGLARPRRLLVLALVLACPAYIYYTRSFLMDPMELMCCAWFLLGFVRAMDQRSWAWLLVANVAGIGAALIKSATFAVWLWPAVGYGAWLLWRDLRPWRGWVPPLRTVGWGAATVVVPLGLLRAWVMYTDPIKAAHASAWIFTSEALAQGNWGLFDLKAIFSAQLWGLLLGCWEQAIMSRWVIAVGLLAGLAFPAWRGRVLAATACFFISQMLLPNAYAYQDYYFYSCALFVLAALGFALCGALDSRLPRWLAGLLVLVPFAAQVHAYRADYFKGQATVFSGDLPVTAALRELTPKNSVLVIAGADWAAMMPYYAQRKTLMVRNGLEFDQAYLRRAYGELADEEVVAVVLWGALRQDGVFINFTLPRFDMDTSAPTFSSREVDVYIARRHAAAVRAGLQDTVRYSELTVPAVRDEAASRPPVQPVTAEMAEKVFAGFTPLPERLRFQYGTGRQGFGNRTVVVANPDADLWVTPPATATTIEWGFGIFPPAYEKAEAHSDGVEFIIEAELPDGRSRRILRRVVDPWQNPADRGDQRASIPYRPRPGEVLRFSSRPYGSSAYDWAYWTDLTVR